MDNIDDVEKAPMLTGQQPSSFEEEEEEEELQSSPHFSTRSKSINLFFSKPLLVIYSLLGILCLLAFTVWATDRSRPWRRKHVYWNSNGDDNDTTSKPAKILLKEAYLTGNRTRRFRDSLLPDQKYITAFVTAGWTNDVMATIHTIQLALLSNRIPILPPFPPSHTGAKSGLLLFSEVFDLPRLSQSLNIPIIEWHDIKETTNPHPDQQSVEMYGDRWNNYYGGETEEIGCWSLWMTQHGRGALAREGRIPEAHNLDVSWTPVPWGYQITEQAEEYSTYKAASLATPGGREEGIASSKNYLDFLATQMKALGEALRESDGPTEIPTKNHAGHQLEPDDQLVCYDYLYFMSTYTPSEWWQPWTPAWDTIGKEVHWAPHVRSLAVSLLHAHLNTTSPTTISSKTSTNDSSPQPPTYIAVHIRRHDFQGWCGGVSREDCLAPLEAYAKRVSEVLSDLHSTHPNLPSNIPVLVMSDEPKTSPYYLPPGASEAWWKSVSDLGWIHIDHDFHQTAEKYGVWYPAVLDAAMLSLASAFVGTERSTYSLLAQKRVSTWQNAPTRFVRWGYPGADNH